jgi:hypothetical protein
MQQSQYQKDAALQGKAPTYYLPPHKRELAGIPGEVVSTRLGKIHVTIAIPERCSSMKKNKYLLPPHNNITPKVPDSIANKKRSSSMLSFDSPEKLISSFLFYTI